jgi:hypothetical protein
MVAVGLPSLTVTHPINSILGVSAFFQVLASWFDLSNFSLGISPVKYSTTQLDSTTRYYYTHYTFYCLKFKKLMLCLSHALWSERDNHFIRGVCKLECVRLFDL